MALKVRNPLLMAADLLDPPSDTWEALPHQIPPPGRWFIWLLLGGRGAGKTAACARYFHEHVNGPPCIRGVPGGHWPAIIAPTLGDGVTSCVNGPSGLRLHEPGIKLSQTAGGTVVRWPNGTEAKIFGAHTPEDVERLRSGGNRCIVWAEELAAWRYMEDCWQHMRYGLRVGPRPHVIASTTPKARALIKKLVKDALSGDEVVLAKATTDDNPHLPGHIRKALYEDYGGTRLGRQELLAEILDDVENALWTPDVVERNRIRLADLPDYLARTVVSVDPAASEGGDKTGIIVSAVSPPYEFYQAMEDTQDRAHGFVLADYSLRAAPKKWAQAVVNAYHDHGANLVVAEKNNGGEMVSHTIHTEDPHIPVKLVWASKGKTRRAEPVSLAYEQNRVHHVGVFDELEEQMYNFDPVDPDESWSPDLMDAMVWGLTELLIQQRNFAMGQYIDDRLLGRR